MHLVMHAVGLQYRVTCSEHHWMRHERAERFRSRDECGDALGLARIEIRSAAVGLVRFVDARIGIDDFQMRRELGDAGDDDGAVALQARDNLGWSIAGADYGN